MGDISKLGQTVLLKPVYKLELCRPDADESNLNSDLFGEKRSEDGSLTLNVDRLL